MTATASSITTTRIDDAAALFIVSLISSALYITRTEVKKSVIHKRRAMLNGKVSRRYGKRLVVLSETKKGRPTHRPEGDAGEGSTLRTTFFACKTKGNSVSLGAFWFS